MWQEERTQTPNPMKSSGGVAEAVAAARAVLLHAAAAGPCGRRMGRRSINASGLKLLEIWCPEGKKTTEQGHELRTI